MNTNKFALKGKFTVIVRPNSDRNEIIGWDEAQKAWRVAIAAPAERNKANLVLIKFLSKLTKKKVRIVAGLASKEKLLEIS